MRNQFKSLFELEKQMLISFGEYIVESVILSNTGVEYRFEFKFLNLAVTSRIRQIAYEKLLRNTIRRLHSLRGKRRI